MSGRDGRCCCGELYAGACPHTSPDEKAESRALLAQHTDHPTPRRRFIAGALAGLALPFIRTPRVAANVGMTDEQARMVQAICNGADGECISCAEELRDALIEAFPEHADAFREVHAERYGNWWRDDQ